MMLNDKPNLAVRESGVKLALRALGMGSVYAFAGVGAVSALIWFSVGAKNVSFLLTVSSIDLQYFLCLAKRIPSEMWGNTA